MENKTRRYSSKKHAAAQNHHLNNFVALDVDFFLNATPDGKSRTPPTLPAPWLGGSLHLMKAQNKSRGPVLLKEREREKDLHKCLNAARCCTRRKENAFICASLSR